MERRLTVIDGLRLHLRASRPEQDYEIAREVIASDCYRLTRLRRLFPRVNTVLDVGGHIGSFGLLAKKLWPRARVIAFEPNKESFDLYSANIAENGFRDIHVVQAALAYNRERCVLLDGDNSTGGCVLKSREEADELAARQAEGERYRVVDAEVRGVTVEETIKEFGLKTVELSKWDCEGSEVEIFSRIEPGTLELFAVLVGEYHLEGGLREFKKLLEHRDNTLKVFGLPGNSPIGTFWAARRTVPRALFMAADLYRRIRPGRCPRPLG